MLPAIRHATLDDVPAIVAIEQLASTASHWPAEEYEKMVKTGVVLVAEQAGNVSGFVCAKAVVEEWEIENIVVGTEFLRQGVGGSLMLAFIAQAGRLNASRVLLEVRESNGSARRLYEKYGFHEVGRRSAYYNHPREDALLYEYRCV